MEKDASLDSLQGPSALSVTNAYMVFRNRKQYFNLRPIIVCIAVSIQAPFAPAPEILFVVEVERNIE